MRFANFLAFLLVLAFFSGTALAQACIAAGQEIIELTHPKDSTTFYTPFEDTWGAGVQDGPEFTHSKGTSKLIIKAGAIASTQSELPNKPKFIFSKYNKAADYEKFGDWAPVTIAGLPAFFIEFKDKTAIPNYGKTTIIFGEEVEGQKKYYAFTILAKQANYEAEETKFNSSVANFSLDPIAACTDDSDDSADDSTDDADNADDSADDAADDSADDSTDDAADQDDADNSSQDDSADEDNDSTDETDSGSGSNTSSGDGKIFGFDPLIVGIGVVLLILLAVFVLIVLAVIGVLAYLAFFKKR